MKIVMKDDMKNNCYLVCYLLYLFVMGDLKNEKI
jgi:hypothetical protein